MGAETVRKWVSKGVNRIALVAETPADARDVMIEGESGLLNIFPESQTPLYEPSKRKITFYNGAVASIYSGANPDLLRGPQHEKAWCDEIASWDYPQGTWDNLMFGLRLGNNPQCVVTGTPRPIKIIKELIKDEDTEVTRGNSYENKSNLTKQFYKRNIAKYEGTRLGRQEIYAEVLDDAPGALWQRDNIDDLRVYKHPELSRIVVADDPAVTSKDDSDETGIVVAGIGTDNHAYVLDDRSCVETPNGWAVITVDAYNEFKADRIIGEANNGGDLIEMNIRTVDKDVPYKKVWASRGKAIRAEPIAALYEQGKVHHMGKFNKLEDEMCNWEPGMKSPNRMDALVWALTELMLNENGSAKVRILGA